jgi:hypothetical protein
MDATVAEKEVGMSEWNDGRLDDLGERVDRIERKMDEGFARIDAKFDLLIAHFDDKLTALHRMLFQAAWGFAIGLIGLVGLIATKL